MIRSEMPQDVETIRDLTNRAFAGVPYGDGSEAPIIEKLREDGDLTISLVAEVGGVVVGHVAISPVVLTGGFSGWFGLGPIAVVPEQQGLGIGRALMEAALYKLRSLPANGCALIGSPDLYSKFGFISNGELSFGELDRKYVQFIAFDGSDPKGPLQFAPAFDMDPNTPK